MRPGKPPSGPLFLALPFTAIAAWMAVRLFFGLGAPAANLSALLLGLSLGPCLAVYALVPVRGKQAVRRLILLSGGCSILSYSLLAQEDLDLEGFFLLLLRGVGGAAIGHTLITLVLGPMLGGRFLCGWGCWRAMVMELLPVGQGRGRRAGAWRFPPLAGLAATLVAAAAGAIAFRNHPGPTTGSFHQASTFMIAVSVAAYYLAAIGLAFALRDQRAFCKYLCPSAVILRLTSRFSLFKMAANPRMCNNCGACTRVCPMDIDVRTFAKSGRRVGTGECILCQRCAQACPTGALRVSLHRSLP